MSLDLYTYKADVIRVIDGDTVDARIDLGFDTWKKIRIRFYGIDTPESRTTDSEEKTRGLAAKQRLTEILEFNNNIFILKSLGVDKYGRCLAELFVDSLGDVSVQQTLINEGHGVAYFGGTR
jgi:micrococcal nuclease